MSDATLSEKIGALSAKTSAAHSRIDKLETTIRDDLKDLKRELHELNAHMNRGKGWSAAIMLLSGTVGGVLVKLLSSMLDK